MLHQCSLIFAIAVLLLGSGPVLLNADVCNSAPYHSVRVTNQFENGDIGVLGCPRKSGCYEFYTTGPGNIKYQAGCNALGCTTASRFDANIHTCVRCKERASEKVPAAGDTLCSSASILKSLGRDSKKHACLAMTINMAKDKNGFERLVLEDDPLYAMVFCNTDTKCGTMLWRNVPANRMETNYTGCISDCNKAFLDAGGSGKCIECDNESDCQQKRPTTFIEVHGTKGSAAGTPAAGMPAAGMPAAGMPAAGMPAAGMPAAGMPAAGMPAAGGSAAGGSAAGGSAAGGSATGGSAAGGSAAGGSAAGGSAAGGSAAGGSAAGGSAAGGSAAGGSAAGGSAAGGSAAGGSAAGVSGPMSGDDAGKIPSWDAARSYLATITGSHTRAQVSMVICHVLAIIFCICQFQ